MKPSTSNPVWWNLLSVISIMIALVAVEFLVRTPGFWTLVPSLSARERFFEPAVQRSPYPQIIFAGNSRIRVGISPKIIENMLELPSGAVANFAFDGAMPDELLGVFQNHPAQLGSARFMIIGVGGKTFNKGLSTRRQTSFIPWESPSLSDRLQAESWEGRIYFTVGWFWKTWDARSILRQYAKNVLKETMPFAGFGHNPYVDDLGRIMLAPEPNSHPSDSQAMNRTDLVNYQPDEMQLHALRELIILANSNGTDVILIDAPLGPVYRSMVQGQFPREDTYWRDQIEQQTGLNVIRLPITSAQCSDWTQCFVDDGHLNHRGAEAYSEQVGDWLLNHFSKQVLRATKSLPNG